MNDDTQRVKNLLRRSVGTARLSDDHLNQYIAQEIARRAGKTIYLGDDKKQGLPFGVSLPYGLGNESTARYVTLPSGGVATTNRWVIELMGFAGRPKPIGIKVVGDVVLGVARAGYQPPDLDLSSHDADEKGVSRRHAVIRPSRNRLYLIDLESTNGTRVNAVPVGCGVAMELHDQDTVSLGALTFTLRIVATPAHFEKEQAAGQLKR